MLNRLTLGILLVLTVSCAALDAPPARFPQLNEQAITGISFHESPKWSPDGKYIAFIDHGNQTLVVYEVQTQKFWAVATNIYDLYFEWTPHGDISYLLFRDSPSGYTFPKVYDLHIVNRDGTNDHVIMKDVYSPLGFAWFADGQRLVALLGTYGSHEPDRDLYLVDTATSVISLIASRQDLNITFPSALSLSSDDDRLAIYAIRRLDASNESVIIIYDLANRVVTREIPLSQIDPQLGLLDGGFEWVRGKQWIFTYGSTSQGDCAPVALHFINTDNLPTSFCISTVDGTIHGPALSPDLSHIVYTIPVQPQRDFVMLASLAPEYRVRLTH